MTKIFDELDNQDIDIETKLKIVDTRLSHGRNIFFEHQKNEKISLAEFNSDILDDFWATLQKYDTDCLQEFSEYFYNLDDEDKKHQLEIYQKHNHDIDVPTNNSDINVQKNAKDVSYLDEIIKSFISIKNLKKLRPSTVLGIKQRLSTFSKIIENPRISELNDEHIRKYQKILPQLPKNMNKDPKLKKMTLNQKIASTTPKIETQTIINIAKTIQEFLRWCYDQNYVNRDYSTILKGIATKTKKPNENIDRFSVDELEKIFGLLDYKQLKFKKDPYKHWILLLGLYTGARLNEICQLVVHDIKRKEDIWYIDFTDDYSQLNSNGTQTKNFKNRSSKRETPIHKKLIQLGFITFVEQCKQRNQNLLFDQLTQNRDGKYLRKASEFFNSNYNNVGVLLFVGIEKKRPNGAKLNFHSFRNTLRDEFKQKLIETAVVNEIIGHEHTDTGNRIYTNAYSMKHKKTTIDKISFDFTHPPKWT